VVGETIGFLGTGRIASAVVEGLMREAGPANSPVVVSPRNAQRAAALADKFPGVSVAADNQAVIDRSRVVFLCVRPQAAMDVLTPLAFRSDQTVVSLIPMPAAVIRPTVAPARSLLRVLPLPTCARGIGAVPYWPAAEDDVRELLARLGRPLPLASEHEFSVLWTATALIAPFYTFMETTAAWAVENGAAADTASDYVAGMFNALAAVALDGPADRFGHLAAEGATPGGLNEQALAMLRAGGACDRVREALDAILKRITTA
jgi:pyrroline-5-carboxylate reductase